MSARIRPPCCPLRLQFVTFALPKSLVRRRLLRLRSRGRPRMNTTTARKRRRRRSRRRSLLFGSLHLHTVHLESSIPRYSGPILRIAFYKVWLAGIWALRASKTLSILRSARCSQGTGVFGRLFPLQISLFSVSCVSAFQTVFFSWSVHAVCCPAL